MARSASTNDRTGLILEMLQLAQCKAESVLYYKNNGSWVRCEDLDEEAGIQWDKSAKINKYANFTLLPVPSSINFQVINSNGEYTPGSGSAKENLFDIETKIKLKSGYLLNELTDLYEEACDIGSAAAFFYYTTAAGNVLTKTPIDPGYSEKYFNDLFDTFGSVLYSDLQNYTPAGFMVYTIDTEGRGFSEISKIRFLSNTSSANVYYRTFDGLAASEAVMKTSGFWSNGGAASIGENEISVSLRGRYIQIAVLFDGGTWTDGAQVSNLRVVRGEFIEWIYYDTFEIDDVKFNEPSAPSIPRVTISGRDAYKRAIEQDINIPTVNGLYIDDIIKNVCNQIGLTYTADSIEAFDTVTFPARTLATGLGGIVKAETVFEYCMQILNKAGIVKYQMFMKYDSITDDSVLYVQPRPVSYEADMVFDSRDYLSLDGFKKDRDRLLQRMSVYSEKPPIDEEVTLSTPLYNTAGTKIITWSGAAAYKRYTVEVLSGDAVVILNPASRVDKTAITFDITGTVINVQIRIYGSKPAAFTGFQGEDITHENMTGRTGITSEIVNPLIISDDECKAIAQGFVEEYGAPTLEVGGLRWPYLNLIVDINDMVLIWSRFLFIENLYFIQGFKYNWNRGRTPSDSTVISTVDSGQNFLDEGAIIYDRDIYTDLPAINYDRGFLYEMDFGPNGTEAAADLVETAEAVFDV
jgi:hypothetical protein